ncbi:MAG: FG-GAP repeat domain-containing protein [Solirubrobacteraceae bacterium]
MAGWTAAQAAGLSFGPASPLTVGSGPSAIASGDFNGDGVPDLAVANENDNTVSILLSNGSGGFNAGPAIPVGTNPDAITAGYFDSSGHEDLAVANYADDTVSILLGNGAGTFTEAPGSPVAVNGRPTALSYGTYVNATTAIAVIAGGTVSFIDDTGPGSTYSVDSAVALPSAVPHAQALATASFDGATNPGLAVLDSQDGTVYVFNSNGTAFIAAPGSPFAGGSAGGYGLSIAAGSFSTGAHPGVAVGFDTGEVSVLLGGSTGALSLAPGSPVQATTDQAIAIAPLSTGKSVDGVAVAGYFQGGCAEPCVTPTDQVAVLTNNGSGGLSQASGSPYALYGVATGIASGPFISGAAADGVAVTDAYSCHGNAIQPLYVGLSTPPSTEYSGDGCQIPMPVTTTDPATGVSLAGATLNGDINPNHQKLTDCHFEYGVGAYDHTIACGFSGQYADTSIHATITGLSPKTTYQFRLVAATAGGSTTGVEQTFKTCDASEVKKPPLDATGCFTRGPDGTWTGVGNVRINGIDFDPGSGGGVSIDPSVPSVTLTGSGSVVLGGAVTVWGWRGRTTLKLGGTIQLTGNASGRIYGFPLAGSLTAKLSEGTDASGGEATITGSVSLNALGDPVTAALSVTTSDADGIAGAAFRVLPADANNNYSERDECEPDQRPPLGFTCGKIERANGTSYDGLLAKEPGVVRLLGFLPVEGLSGSFDRSSEIWSLTASIAVKDALPGAGFITGAVPTLTLGATFHGSTLVGGQIGDSDTAINLGIAELKEFNFDAQFYPRITLGGDASLGAGPEHTAIQISAGAELEQGSKSGWDLKVNGTFSLQNELSVGGSVEYDGRDGSNSINVGGTFAKSYGPVSLTATLGGGIGNGQYQLTARGDLNAFGLADLGANGVISNAGFGLCATAHAFIVSGDIGFKHFWSGETDFNGCDFSGLYTVGSGPAGNATVAAAATRTAHVVVLHRGLSKEEIGIVGVSAAPDVMLRGPGGARLQTPATADRFQRFGRAGYALAVTSSKTTWFILRAPAAGRWTVSPLPGSAAIVRVERADPLRALRLAARVTGAGSHRVLHWTVAPQHGVTIRFVQDGGGEPTVALSARPGRARFTVIGGRPGIRRVLAVVIVDGLPRAIRTIARFRVARPPLPRVVKARYRLTGRKLTVSWRRARGAVQYELGVRVGTGLERWLLTAAVSHATVSIPAGVKLKRVTIVATAANRIPGPPVTASLSRRRMRR